MRMLTPLAALLICVVHLRAQNLVINGGFESGFAGWTGTFGYYDSPNTVDGYRVGVLTDISHSSVGQTLTQVLPTTAGQTYSIAFALRLPELYEIAPGFWIPVTGDSRGGTTSISVRWDDRTLAAIPVLNRDSWSFYTIQAVADDDSTRLNFFSPSAAAWPFIDGVSVTVVPEPSPLLLGLLGIALFVGLRAIRRSERHAIRGQQETNAA